MHAELWSPASCQAYCTEKLASGVDCAEATVPPYALRMAEGTFHYNVCVLAIYTPCLSCRREGNRKAAARLRLRRQAEVQALQSRVQQYEQEASPAQVHRRGTMLL